MKTFTAAGLIVVRQALGMTQTEFWGCFGVTQSGGSRYETGREIPRPVQLLLNAAFGDWPEAITALREQRHKVQALLAPSGNAKQ